MKKVKKIIKTFFSTLNVIYFKFKKINISYNTYCGGNFFIRNKGKISIGKNCCLRSGIRENPVGSSHKFIFDVRKNAVVTIGNNVGISNVNISSFQSVTIEDDVMIGSSTQIYDSDHHSLDYNIRISGNDTNIHSLPIVLKKGCFIGTNSIILKGVTIGEHSIIGAGSVVTKSIPSDELWAGNPAKFIRKIGD